MSSYGITLIARTGRYLGALSALLAVMSLPVPAARAAEPIVGLRSLAMGDSLRAAASGAEGVLLNPSGIALLKQYAVTAFYGLRLQSLGHQVHVSVADSVTQQRIAVGLYYDFIYESPQVAYRVNEVLPGTRSYLIQGQKLTRTGHEIGLVSAFPLGDRFILGVTTKYGYFSTSGQLPPDQPPPAVTLQNVDGNRVYDLGSLSNVVSFDVGMTLRLFQGFSIGAVGQNLWGHGNELPTLLGVGLAYVASTRWTLAADVLTNFTGNQTCVAAPPTAVIRQDGSAVLRPPCTDTINRITVRVGGGAEYAIADKVPLRAGYLWDSNVNSHSVTAGLGYFSTRFAIDAAMQQQVKGGKETIVLLGFRIFRE